MKREDFDNLLRLWGYYYGPRRQELEAGAGLYGVSSLADLGRPKTIRQTTSMDRGGMTRRQMMGKEAGLLDERGVARVVPTWAADTVRCSETRTGAAKILAPDFSVPPEAQRVERAVFKLSRDEMDLARVMRTEYCTFGRQSDKAKDFGMERKAYRERLAEARGWVRRDLDFV
ncbi:hypothetical protein ACIPR8_11100 [Stenotrophomonas sp. LARHCG68]